MRIRPRQRRQARARQPASDASRKSEYYSYHSNRLSSEASERHGVSGKGTHWYSRWRYIPSYLATIAIIISIGYVLTLSTNPKINTLSGRSYLGLLRTQDSYQKAAEKILGSSILNRSKLTIDGGGFERAMKEQFPELAQAKVTLPLIGRRPIVQLIARKPALTLVTERGVYLIDNTGVAIIKAGDVANLASLELPSVVDESNLEIVLGKGMITSQEVTFILITVYQIQAAKQPIGSLSLPPIINEFHIKLKDQSYVVKFDMQNDPRTSAGAFLSFKKQLDTDNITPSEYVDARLEDRIYYK